MRQRTEGSQLLGNVSVRAVVWLLINLFDGSMSFVADCSFSEQIML